MIHDDFKIGDKIIINKKDAHVCWYVPDIFTVVDFDTDCLVLNKNLCEGYNNLLHISYAVNLTKQRKQKLNKLNGI